MRYFVTQYFIHDADFISRDFVPITYYLLRRSSNQPSCMIGLHAMRFPYKFVITNEGYDGKNQLQVPSS